MPFTLSVPEALSVIRASEGREPGPGHTLERHVDITREALYGRNTTSRTAGELQLFCAFNSIHDCALALSRSITALAAEPFVRDFDRIADDRRMEVTAETVPPMLVRYSAGEGRKFPVTAFRVVAVRMRARPYGLHLITFYPTLVME